MISFKKQLSDAERAELVKPYRDFIKDLAEVFPAIVGSSDRYGYYISPPPFLDGFRVKDVKAAAEAVRVANNRKKADALVAELRKTPGGGNVTVVNVPGLSKPVAKKVAKTVRRAAPTVTRNAR